jgi:ABC-type sugar transport system ATPase subunit
MAEIVFESVSKRFGEIDALRDFSLTVGDGEFVVLVGPSGSGKTTALRVLAGLETLTSGRTLIGDRVVDRLAPRDRDIAMVFQDYALYPQMTVFQNLAFALRMRKMGRDEIDGRVRRAADMLDIGELLDRKPRALSGGQRQRVALGRALVREPQAFLMDEPLSNLDAKLRVQTRTEIKHLQEQVGTTTVYVTHDQVEAMTMGDRVAVLHDGLLEQIGTTREVYEHPANVFVAGFIGSPAMSLATLHVTRRDSETIISRDSMSLAVGGSVPVASDVDVTLGIRPEHTRLWTDDPDLHGPVDGNVVFVEALGRETLLGVECGADLRFTVMAPADIAARAGDPVRFGIERGRCYLFDASTGHAIGAV